MSELSKKRCVPCESGIMPLMLKEAQHYMTEVTGWILTENGRSISKHVKCKNFKEALAFTDAVGALAEAEGHHPDIVLKWGSVDIVLSTHAIGGLSLNDFVLAAKIDDIV